MYSKNKRIGLVVPILSERTVSVFVFKSEMDCLAVLVCSRFQHITTTLSSITIWPDLGLTRCCHVN